MPVRLFLDSSTVVNLLRLREERFDRECEQFVDFLDRKKIQANISSSVYEECEEYIKSLSVLAKETFRDLRFYLASRTLLDRYLKPRMFLLLEDFFLEKINEARSSMQKRNQLGIIQQYVSDFFLEALEKGEKIHDFLRKTLLKINSMERVIQDHFDILTSKYPPENTKIIDDLEKFISKNLDIGEKDSRHLAGLCYYTFEKNVWCIFVTTDFAHLLNKPTFRVCWVRCVRPRYVPIYMKSHPKIFGDSPIKYLDETRYEKLSKEQEEALKIIQWHLK